MLTQKKSPTPQPHALWRMSLSMQCMRDDYEAHDYHDLPTS